MYRGFNFNLKLTEETKSPKEIREVTKEESNFRKQFEHLFSARTLKAEDIISNWFPNVKADVFISHSHIDEDLALALSAYLHKNFGLTSFVDSTVWGSGDYLVSRISVPNPYDHVHMILSIALSQMIDRCECLFFLNTPNSVSMNDISKRTYSPWIYYELGISRLIEKKKPKRKLSESQQQNFSQESITYPLDTSHLAELNFDDLENWLTSCKKCRGSETLDYLYMNNPTV